MVYKTIQDIYKMAEMIRSSDSEDAQEFYRQHANLIILKQPKHTQELLENILEWELE